MSNIPGAAGANPGVFSLFETVSRGVSIPTGTRLACLIGEGTREEVIVATANGGGNDGLDPTFSSTTGSDGRHFVLSRTNLISNRTRLFKNGIPLSVLEGTINTDPFDSRFDARVDITNGRIELQRARLVDQGGEFYRAGVSNVGDGEITSLELIDPNAPTETWTVRVASVRRDTDGDPIDGYAKFVVRGSVSGVIKDGYGAPIIWQSNGVVVDNGILRFAIEEGSTPFVEGDNFIIQVQSGALLAGDSLSARYISIADLNDPQFFTSPTAFQRKHGTASLENRLSLGAQLFFANQAPGLFAIQAAPAVPRRQSFVLQDSATGDDDAEDLQFVFPLGVVPDADSSVNILVTDPATGIETQIIPNKVDFYDPAITNDPDSFHFGAAFDFSYTVILADEVRKQGTDGVIEVIDATTATLSSNSVSFTANDSGANISVKIFKSSNNDGEYSVVSVSGGVITLTNPGGFTNESDISFQVLDSDAQSAVLLFTDDLALVSGAQLRVTVVDQKDADFFDAGWTSAYGAAEKIDCDIVVPLPSQTISAIFQNGKAHVINMSSIKNRRERVLFVGGIRGLTPENVLGVEDAAVENIGILEGIQGDTIQDILEGNVEDLADYGVQNAFGDTFRVMYFYPDEIIVQVGADRQVVDGMFIAAAAAAFFSRENMINTPITNKTLTGFTILRDKLFAPLVLENLSAGGIAVLQPAVGGGRVIWGKTTTTSGFPSEEESSVVFIRDRMAKSMRSAFQGFVGTAETPTLQSTLYARALAVMQAFVSQRLITDFADLKVDRDEVEPRQWNISVHAQPVFPVNWIFIRTTIGLI